jgi:ribosomal protein S18 acetylase RimI-like enzyme
VVTELTLRDGTHAMTWSLLQEDRVGLADAYLRLAPESQYHRFLSAVPRLSDAMLRRLVDDVDGVDHVALVLFAFDRDDVARAAGIGRMIRYDDAPDTADVAVTVSELYRGRGVASALLAQLAKQRPRGVRTLLTQVAADNEASLAMLRRLGPTTVTPQSGSILEVRVDLPPEGTLEE